MTSDGFGRHFLLLDQISARREKALHRLYWTRCDHFDDDNPVVHRMPVDDRLVIYIVAAVVIVAAVLKELNCRDFIRLRSSKPSRLVLCRPPTIDDACVIAALGGAQSNAKMALNCGRMGDPIIAGPNSIEVSAVGQYICCPPLIDIVDPVTNPASSLHRNATPRAISSAWPKRPTGIFATIFSSTGAGTAATMSVSI